jgi:hypothetical protein
MQHDHRLSPLPSLMCQVSRVEPKQTLDDGGYVSRDDTKSVKKKVRLWVHPLCPCHHVSCPQAALIAHATLVNPCDLAIIWHDRS